MRFAISGFGEHATAEIANFIVTSGGEVTGADEASHLVANSPLFAAPEGGNLDVVTRDWVHRCCSEGVLHDPSEFRIEPFLNITFTSTDLDPDESRSLKRLITRNGGSWRDAYDDSVTILLARHLSITQKTRLALKCGVPIVHPDWIRRQASQFTNIEKHLLNFWCWHRKKSLLFSKLTFGLHKDCDDLELVIEAVERNSGKFAKSSDVLIVPHFFVDDSGGEYVTSNWIWACIAAQKLLPKEDSPVYRPFSYQKVDPGLKGCVIAICGVADPVRWQLTEGLRLLGVTVHFRISTAVKILITDSASGDLLKSAKELGIKAVKPAWALSVLETGTLQSIEDYALEEGRSDLVQMLCDRIKKRSDGIQKKSRFLDVKEIAMLTGDDSDVWHSSPRLGLVGYHTEAEADESPPVGCDALLDALGMV
jgi:hypothetical protein